MMMLMVFLWFCDSLKVGDVIGCVMCVVCLMVWCVLGIVCMLMFSVLVLCDSGLIRWMIIMFLLVGGCMLLVCVWLWVLKLFGKWLVVVVVLKCLILVCGMCSFSLSVISGLFLVR